MISLFKKARPANREKRNESSVETLERRIYLSAPSISGLSVVENTDGTVTISGNVQDESPETATVDLSGIVTDSVTPDSNGDFSVVTDPSSLGTVYAVATDDESLQSGTEDVELSSDAPSITLSIQYGEENEVTLSGTVTDEAPGGLAVTLSGAVDTTVVFTDSNGNYSVTFDANELGTVYADVDDQWEQASTTAQAEIDVDVPAISNFVAIEEQDGTWTFKGTVTHQSAENLEVVLGGILEGYSLTAFVDENGQFEINLALDPEDEGTATAEVEDWWGQDSNVAEVNVEQ